MSGDERLAVVYDPATDRFVLQDAPAPVRTHALPWHEWVLPPKTAALDDAPSSLAARSPAKRTRVCDYAAHFAHANAQLPPLTHDETPRTSAITWNGEPLLVSVARSSPGVDDSSSRPPAAPSAAVASVQHVFELAELARIRPFADGYRSVNADCTFAALTSSSSSEDEHMATPSTLSDDDDALRLPVFVRGDRVVVRVRRRRVHGTVARRIGCSSFYDVRAASGTLFAAVSALRMRLLPLETSPPRSEQRDFERGDRVLWVPAPSSEQQEEDHAPRDTSERQQTYKARVVQRRSRSRFDIELRTGRIRCKVPSSELVPAQW